MIPEVAVEAAATAYVNGEVGEDVWHSADPEAETRLRARAVLEAAAPHMRGGVVATVDELDALPIGSVVLSDGYLHHANGMPIAFQRWPDGGWHRGARSSSTHPDNFVPATLLYRGIQ